MTAFSSMIMGKIQKNSDYNAAEPLVHLEYKEETVLKNEAIKKFFSRFLNAEDMKKIKPIIPSPLPRKYRTTTKRRVFLSNGRLFMLSGEGRKFDFNGPEFNQSLLEPDRHREIYELIYKGLNTQACSVLCMNLNYVIIRGDYSAFTVIFNICKINAELIRRLKNLGSLLQNSGLNVVSSFVYFDPERSDYYLESRRPESGIALKKLFGNEKISVRYGNNKYFYAPVSFSQINASIVPLMLDEAAKGLCKGKAKRLVDLYCGYGLFSYHLAENFSEVMGIDAEGSSIDSAIESIKFFRKQYPHTRFRFNARNIRAKNLDGILPSDNEDEVFILDPPRQGTERGVIETIASRNPKRVLHIFCGIEQIPVELREWKRQGYVVESILPLDMFPGTPGIETMIFLKKQIQSPASDVL